MNISAIKIGGDDYNYEVRFMTEQEVEITQFHSECVISTNWYIKFTEMYGDPATILVDSDGNGVIYKKGKKPVEMIEVFCENYEQA